MDKKYLKKIENFLSKIENYLSEINYKKFFDIVLSKTKQYKNIVIITILFFLPLTIYFYVRYLNNFGVFGDFIGGVIGTIIAFLVFKATLKIIKLQREAIDLQEEELQATRRELRKQRFEETFFSLIKLLDEKQLVPIEKNNENKDYHIVYGLIKEIIAMIKIIIMSVCQKKKKKIC